MNLICLLPSFGVESQLLSFRFLSNLAPFARKFAIAHKARLNRIGLRKNFFARKSIGCTSVQLNLVQFDLDFRSVQMLRLRFFCSFFSILVIVRSFRLFSHLIRSIVFVYLLLFLSIHIDQSD